MRILYTTYGDISNGMTPIFLNFYTLVMFRNGFSTDSPFWTQLFYPTLAPKLLRGVPRMLQLPVSILFMWVSITFLPLRTTR